MYLNFTSALFSLFYSSSFYYFFNYIQAVFTIYQMNKLGSWISLSKFAQPNKTIICSQSIKVVWASVFLNNKFSKKCILFIKSNILWVFSPNHVGLMTFFSFVFPVLEHLSTHPEWVPSPGQHLPEAAKRNFNLLKILKLEDTTVAHPKAGQNTLGYFRTFL